MKKNLLLLASAALLLVGCAKEKFAEPNDGGLTSVTFSASVDGGVVTKAFADGDGKGTNVNRCIMEIYFQNQLYKRMEAAMSGTPATTTFANVPVVAGKEYQILFWADHVDVVNTEAGLATDKYYTTKTTTDNKGLKAVTVNKTNFIDALKSKKNDELDAFFFADNYTVPQGGKSYTAKLKRPFAQLNVITTDVGEGKTVVNANLLPEKVSVSYTAATTFNVADSTVTGSATYAYEAPVYGVWSDTKSELTLSMDYILASTDKSAIDVTFITKNGDQAVMTHSLANLPYKRNYRTNVKGDLLTTAGSWTATINPIWSSPDIVKVVEVADIHSANQIINQYKGTTDHLEVKFTAEPNDSGEPTGEATSAAKAIVTTPIEEGKTLSIEVLADTKKLYIGDYPNEYTVTSVDTDNAKPAVVNVNVPIASKIKDLFINAPTKSVYINGKEVANVGTITNLDAITSQNTLIIEKGQKVGTLTIRQGGLEIHGTVGTLVISENGHDNNPVLVRTSENLSQTVFDEIYKEEGGVVKHDYIDRPDFSERQNANGTWDIVPSVCKIEETYYGSLAAAVAAVPANAQTTITMVADHEILGNAGVTIPATKNIVLDLAGFTVKNLVNESKASQIIANYGTLKITGNGTLINALADGVIPGDWPTYNYITNLITNSGVLTIENGVFSNTQDSGITYALDNISNGSLAAFATINGGTFKSVGNSAVRMFCNSTTAANTLTINGGYFEGYYFAVAVQNPNTSDNCGTLTINGGEFESKDDTEGYNACIANRTPKSSNIAVNIAGGKFNDYVLIASKASVTGGLFRYTTYTYPGDTNESKLADYVADGYAVVANTDPATKAKYPYTVKVKPVVKIGNVEYADIADAFDAVPTDGTPTTVTLLENIGSKVENEIVWKEYDRVYAYTINKDQNVTFDLNGHKIYAKTTVNGETCFFRVENCGTLKIQDSSNGGELNYLDGNDNTGGFAICSAGNLTIESGTIENHTECENSAIQGAIDVHANEWGTPYAHHVTFTMNGGVLKSHTDNTLRLYDSSQTGTGGVVIDSEINGGEIYGADAVFIMTQWTKTYCTGNTYMNNINLSVKGGKFVTNNGIRVVGNVGENNNKDYRAIKINVFGGEFTILANTKYRENNVAFQESAGWTSDAEATAKLRSYTDVIWTAESPTYSTPAQ